MALSRKATILCASVLFAGTGALVAVASFVWPHHEPRYPKIDDAYIDRHFAAAEESLSRRDFAGARAELEAVATMLQKKSRRLPGPLWHPLARASSELERTSRAMEKGRAPNPGELEQAFAFVHDRIEEYRERSVSPSDDPKSPKRITAE